ncbi:hypothetical protein BC835DRAFT_1342977 [Cytidiella melzeri]|nr:hypothetical protein BC835DRAFT_1342977 [Cytidiella melzeri]
MTHVVRLDVRDVNDYGKARILRQAIERIAQLTIPIESVDDLDKVPRLNPDVKLSITRWLQSRELPNTDSKPFRENHLKSLMTVPGIGRARAKELISAGAKTLGDLWKPEFFESLTDVQKSFLQLSNLIKEESDAQVAERVQESVKNALIPTIDVVLVGDHRRGVSPSPITQLLVINPKHEYVPSPASTTTHGNHTVKNVEGKEGNPIAEMLGVLRRRGIIAADFRVTSYKWTGVLRIPWRSENGDWESQSDRLKGVQKRTGEFKRVDIVFAPVKSRGAAMITATGDDSFVADVRKKARHLGLYFNEFGLWQFHPEKPDSHEGKKKKLPGTWEHLPLQSEEEIFAKLGIDWLDPEKRNFEVPADGKLKKRSKKY